MIVARDPFAGYAHTRGQSFDNFAVVTPSDDDELPVVAEKLWVDDGRLDRVKFFTTIRPASFTDADLNGFDAALVQKIAAYRPDQLATLDPYYLAPVVSGPSQNDRYSRALLVRNLATIDPAQFGAVDFDTLIPSTVMSIGTGSAMPSVIDEAYNAVVALGGYPVQIGQIAVSLPSLTDEIRVLIAQTLAVRAVRAFDDLTMRVTSAGGSEIILTGFSGEIEFPIRVRKVWATGTTSRVTIGAFW